MTDDFILDKWADFASSGWPVQFDKDDLPQLLRLLALARRGAAVKWRPVAEAPKDGTFMFCQTASGFQIILQFCQDGYWRRDARDDGKHGAWHPTHFIPLSALGVPEDERITNHTR